MDASIRHAHEKFVSGHNGSHPLDIILAVFPVVPGCLASILLQGNSSRIGSFLLSFILCVIPLILSFTVLNEAHTTVIFTTCMIAAIGYVKFLVDGKKGLGISNYPLNFCPYVTFAKSTVNMCTIIAILAVDFNCFPRRFAKTEEYGYGLMDIGLSCFISMHGFLDTKRRPESGSALKGTLMLFDLGFLRLGFVLASNYQHHVTEYGMHANFFFLLAILKLICSGMAYTLTISSGILGSCALMLIHHMLLEAGLEHWTLSDLPREDLLLANREFLVSFPGYLVLYIIGATAGKFFLNLGISKKRKITVAMVIVFLLGQFLFILNEHYYILPSRRLGNPAFVIWSTVFMLFFLTVFLVLEVTVEYLTSRSIPNVALFDSVNKHPLAFFLFGNIFTGLINLSINTLSVTYPLDICILISYSFVTLFIVYLLG